MNENCNLTLSNIEKQIAQIRTEQMELLVAITELNRRYKENTEDRIRIRTLVIIMLISYLLFLGEKVKDLLNLDLIKALL